MPYTDTVIIGAGHAGLAMSRCLADRDVPHVVLDRGCVGERWRTARWDSFRLLTPNWLSRLPGWRVHRAGAGRLHVRRRVRRLPVRLRPLLRRPGPAAHAGHPGGAAGTGFVGPHRPRRVVGALRRHRDRLPQPRQGPGARRRAGARRGPADRRGVPLAVEPARRRRAGRRRSASGVQIAHELAGAGRRVVLAVGSHTRLPRRYRGRDILWWLDRIGSLDRSIDQVPDRRAPGPSRRCNSPDTEGRRVWTSTCCGGPGSGWSAGCAARRYRTPSSPTTWRTPSARRSGGLTGCSPRSTRTRPRRRARPHGCPIRRRSIAVPAGPSRMDLRRAGISAVVWATGYRPWYPWLRVPVLDTDGRIRHRRGVTDVPGLYAIGLRFQYRRNSTFVDGARHDAAYLADQITASRRGAGGGVRWTPMTSSWSAPGPPAPRPRCCWPGRDGGYCCWTATGTAPTRCPPTR